MNKTKVLLAIAMIALVIIVAGCTSNNDSYNDPRYQRTVGGGCGVAGKESRIVPELVQPPAPGI